MRRAKDLAIYEPGATFKKGEIGVSERELALIEERVVINRERILRVQLGLGGEVNIYTNQYVGFGHVDGINLTIFPKVFKRARDRGLFDTQDEAIAFIRMLDTALQLELKESHAMLRKRGVSEGGLHEVLMYLYTFMLYRELQNGVYRRYIRRVYDEPFLRGKLLVSRQIRKLPHQLITFTQERYTLSMDNELNRVLRLAAALCEQLSRHRDTVTYAKLISHMLSEVTMYRDTKALVTNREPVFNRLNERFRRPYNLARLLLHRIEVGRGRETYGFFIKMNDLFERFIYQLLKRELTGYEVVHERPIGKLLRDMSVNRNGEVFAQYPDITVSKNRRILLVVDVKYKELKGSKDQDKEGYDKIPIDVNDVRQMYVYSRLAHKVNRVLEGKDDGKAPIPNTILIYPYLEGVFNEVFDDHPQFEFEFIIDGRGINKLIITRYDFKNLRDERVTDNELIRIIRNSIAE